MVSTFWDWVAVLQPLISTLCLVYLAGDDRITTQKPMVKKFLLLKEEITEVFVTVYITVYVIFLLQKRQKADLYSANAGYSGDVSLNM